uniref:Uncharacterized protein n=1 Tax=Octopus bimaculoides TaxID=37653 RepID=A0A0L8GDA1_OCTBM
MKCLYILLSKVTRRRGFTMMISFFLLTKLLYDFCFLNQFTSHFKVKKGNNFDALGKGEDTLKIKHMP